MGDINKAVDWLVVIADDDTHGYSQANRQGPDYDCSSSILNALKQGGSFDVNVNGYTGNMLSILKGIGYKEVTDSTCKKTDIYLTPGKHVVMSYKDGYVITAAGDKDGKTGDSSGKEIYKRAFYTPSYGWTYHLRYSGTTSSSTTTTSTAVNSTYYKVGSTYTLQANVAVRTEPSKTASLVGYDNLTTDGKKHDTDKNGYLEKGTMVTCKNVSVDTSGNTWIKTPSGWMCAIYNGEVLIK